MEKVKFSIRGIPAKQRRLSELRGNIPMRGGRDHNLFE